MKFLVFFVFCMFISSSVFSGDKKVVSLEEQVKILTIPKFKFQSTAGDLGESLSKVLKDKEVYLFFDKVSIHKSDSEKVYKFDFNNISLGKMLTLVCQSTGLACEFYNNSIVIYDRGTDLDKVIFNKFYPGNIIQAGKLDKADPRILRQFISDNGISLNYKTNITYTKNGKHLFFMGHFTDVLKLDEIFKKYNKGKYGLISTDLKMPTLEKEPKVDPVSKGSVNKDDSSKAEIQKGVK